MCVCSVRVGGEGGGGEGGGLVCYCEYCSMQAFSQRMVSFICRLTSCASFSFLLTFSSLPLLSSLLIPFPPLPSPFFFSSQYEDILKAENEGSNSPGIYRTQSYDAVLFDLRKIPPEKIAVGHYCATVREDSGRPLSSH